MRLSTDVDRDEDRACATIAAALDSGVTWLDTARAYGRDEEDLGHNERLLGRVLGQASEHVRVVTKCGMARPGGRWEPDGRASSILASARASATDLGRAPDLLLLHTPDPRTALGTSIRALVRARSEGLARAIGLSNVSRRELDALGDVSIGAVQVALGAFDDASARGGVVAWCQERGIPVLAHSPLGGPARAGRLARDPLLRTVAARHDGATPATIVLAYLLAVSEVIVPLVGARRPETARAAAKATTITLDDADLAQLDARFPGLALVRRPVRPVAPAAAKAEVVVIMGVPGAGKSRLAASFSGYERLNRDTLGGTLDGIARRLDERLAAGVERVVLDNTYVTRASRSEVLRVASARGAAVKCIHVDTPAHEAETNVVLRMLERHGELVGGAELKSRVRHDPGLLGPSALARMLRDLEAPSPEEGFASIEVVPFAREHTSGRAGVAMPLEVLDDAARLLDTLPPDAPVLFLGWRPGAGDVEIARARERAGVLAPRLVEIGVCTHAAGPPVCWCRPPLPGLWLAFARRHGIDPRQSVFVTTTRTHETMARALGIRVSSVP